MATEARIAANRANASEDVAARPYPHEADSTRNANGQGPRTAEGKPRSSRNAVRLGLFTAHNCVQPEEKQEYDNLYKSIWLDLNPSGAMEQMFATEIIRGAWRLRRCAIVEATLATWARNENLKAHRERHEQLNGKDVPYRGTCDPMIYGCTSGTQVAVDRARTQANGTVRRAMAELRRLQTERLFRTAALPENADASQFGLASFEEVLPRLQNEAKAQLLAAVVINQPETQITNQTESAPSQAAPAPAPIQLKHCRRTESPEVLKSAA